MITNLVKTLVSVSITNLITSTERDMLVSNLELEDGANYLLEDGGLILLE